MSANAFVSTNQEGIDEVRIPEVEQIEAPYFSPEIKGPEDLQVLLTGRNLLDENNPFMVQGYRWKNIRSKTQFKDVRPLIQNLIVNNPTFYYEPVDLLRYTRPKNLVTYSFRGSRSSTRRFNEHLRNGRIEDAIEQLPTFFQPFVERELERLIELTKDAEQPSSYPASQGKIYEAWRDPRADQGYPNYFEEIVDDAQKSPHSCIIPPVPPLLKSSGRDTIDRTLGVNRFMMRLCGSKNGDWTTNDVSSYFHIYVDQGAISSNSRNIQDLINRLGDELEMSPSFDDSAMGYIGVAMTISGYDRAWSNNRGSEVEKFVNRISNMARQNGLPLILPRSGWYGLHLTDDGVNGFSSLMNGNPNYLQRTDGGISQDAMFGTVAVYGAATDLNIEQLEQFLIKNGGELPHIDGLPSSPPSYNPTGEDWKGKFGDPKKFRTEFGKLRRFTHAQEAKEMRDGRRDDVPNPARRYLERSDHPYLS